MSGSVQKIGLPHRFLRGLGPLLANLQRRPMAYHKKLMVQLAMGSFTSRSEDIHIVSYPKSGTTLLQMMLYQLTSDGEMDFPHIEAVSP